MKPREKKKNEWLQRNPWGPRWLLRMAFFLASLKLTLHLNMDGWNTSCLLGRLIFRGEMLVSGSVFRWVFDQVSSEHEKILCLKKLEGARFLLFDMLETHWLISPWIEVRTTQPKLAQSAKNHSGSGPRAKDIGFSKDMAPTITSIESLTRKVKDWADLSNGELVVKILPECRREFWSVKHQPYQRWTDLLQTKGMKKV